jgi:hypothetical protein
MPLPLTTIDSYQRRGMMVELEQDDTVVYSHCYCHHNNMTQTIMTMMKATKTPMMPMKKAAAR